MVNFKFKKTINRAVFGIILILLIFNLNQADAEGTITDTIEGFNKAATRAYGGSNNTPEGVFTDIPSAIGKIVGAGLAFIGVIFLILMIYGGFSWMTARGNEQEVTQAKELIYAAVIGLIIILSAYAITSYLSEILFNTK